MPPWLAARAFWQAKRCHRAKPQVANLRYLESLARLHAALVPLPLSGSRREYFGNSSAVPRHAKPQVANLRYLDPLARLLAALVPLPLGGSRRECFGNSSAVPRHEEPQVANLRYLVLLPGCLPHWCSCLLVGRGASVLAIQAQCRAMKSRRLQTCATRFHPLAAPA